MPKEIVHWTIAEIARQNLKEDSPLRKVLDKYYSEYLIGSIAFDIPYYDFFSKDTDRMNKLGSRLHGIGFEYAQTNYDKIVNHFGDQLPEYVWAFIAGSFCHAITDICYHPVVFFYTKDVIEKHREFETNLDLFYIDRVKPQAKSISLILTKLKVNKEDFLTILSLFISGENKTFNKKISTILLKYRIVQFMIREKIFYHFLKLVNNLTKNKFKEIIPLFYKDFKRKSFEIFENPVFYPENERVKKVNLKEIEENTIKEILKNFEKIEKLMKKSDNFQKVREFFTNFHFPPLTGEKIKDGS